MAKFMVKHDRENCIGCGACANVYPEDWEMNEDGKSSFKKGKRLDDGSEEGNIPDDHYDGNKEAAEACPVNVIHIINKETKEKII